MSLEKIKNLLLSNQGSTQETDAKVIEKFTSDPNFPYLVSFPRTGSHWLRMIMELYFKKPSLVRAFYYHKAKDFTCYHSHDLDLSLERQNIIYLYREPIETIFSQLKYHKQNTQDEKSINEWTQLYGRHLKKWLIEESFTKKKTILTYEAMKKDLEGEMNKICRHLDETFDSLRLHKVVARISKEDLSKRTGHDKQVINLSDEYGSDRERFRENLGRLVFDTLFEIDHRLERFFDT